METYVFKLPDVAEGTAEAEVAAWHVSVGDPVKEDQRLIDVMTDKATVEITSPVAGTVTALHAAVGEKVAVGAPLIDFGVGSAERSPSPAVLSTPPPAMVHSPAASAPSGKSAQRPIASPSVRRRARELGVPLEQVRGSGRLGHIVHEDLDSFVAPAQRSLASGGLPDATAAGTVEEIRIVGLRRRIAERMAEAKRTIPHFSYVEEVDVTELEALRAHLNAESGEDRPRLSPLAFVMRAVARLLAAYPDINATFDGEAGILRRHAAVHMGVATQTEKGLMVPVVRHVESRDLWDCAREIARVSGTARSGKATREELTGSTLTLTSLGPLGGIAATPVINSPEVAIIGPNRIVERPAVRAGAIVVRKMMNISSSFDHRIIDGYQAAEFIQRVKALLETPALLFIPR